MLHRDDDPDVSPVFGWAEARAAVSHHWDNWYRLGAKQSLEDALPWARPLKLLLGSIKAGDVAGVAEAISMGADVNASFGCGSVIISVKCHPNPEVLTLLTQAGILPLGVRPSPAPCSEDDG